MIFETLHILKEQLEAYFESIGLGRIIELGNIALWESGSDDAAKLNGKVVITLLKLEEETTLSNNQHIAYKGNKAELKHPPVYLNLYVLICANCEGYDNSLLCISRVIEFFQGHKQFTTANTVYNRSDAALESIDNIKFSVKLYTPTFEEMNNVWGTLGGRQLPSAMYKVQLIQIDRDKVMHQKEIITQIGGRIIDKQL